MKGDEVVVILFGSPQGGSYPSVQEVAVARLVGGEVIGLLADPLGPGRAAVLYPCLLLHQDRHVFLTDMDCKITLLTCGREEAVVLGEVGAGEEGGQEGR